MQVNFTDPNTRLPNELRSKLLKPDSSLYKWLAAQRQAFVDKYGDRVGPMRMDFHVELIRRDEEPTEEMLVSRCKLLEGTDVPSTTLGKLGKAIVLTIASVEGYGPTHITITYFPAGVDGVEL
jgi:hypothetical protein